MKKALQLPVWIVCGYVFIVVGILAEGWVLRLTWLGLGLATLGMNVLLTMRQRGSGDPERRPD